jgi:ATP-dependent RNA helicase RhlE
MLHERIEEDFDGQFGVIHSNKSQNYRLSTMASFQEGNLRGLITTDIMARGLDISNITHVVNLKCQKCQNYTCTVVERVRCNWNTISLIAPREEEFKVEVEVLMNMELAIESSRNSGTSKTNRT